MKALTIKIYSKCSCCSKTNDDYALWEHEVRRGVVAHLSHYRFMSKLNLDAIHYITHEYKPVVCIKHLECYRYDTDTFHEEYSVVKKALGVDLQSFYDMCYEKALEYPGAIIEFTAPEAF